MVLGGGGADPQIPVVLLKAESAASALRVTYHKLRILPQIEQHSL